MKNKKTKPVFLATYELVSSYSIKNDNAEDLNRRFNLHYLGHEIPNKLVKGKLVAKYPEKETPQFMEVINRLRSTHIFDVFVDVYSDGSRKLRLK